MDPLYQKPSDGMTSRNSSVQFQNSPVLHTPPQIFGAYNSDGTPMTPTFSGHIFSSEHDVDDPNGEAKRRRIAKACDMCRKKKIKCDGKMPACTHCLNYKTECIFTQVEKKRNPPKGYALNALPTFFVKTTDILRYSAKYIEGLENRLARMESLLKMSGLLSEDDNGRTDLGTLEKRLAQRQRSVDSSSAHALKRPDSSHHQSTTNSRHDTPVRHGSHLSTHSGSETPDLNKEGGEDVEALSDMMCSLVTNNCGETRYIGSSSGFSIFSPKGIQWVNEKTNDSSFQEMISSVSIDDNKWISWKPEVFGDIFARQTFKPLPPKDEALSLLKDFFENFNCMFPLFHEPTFMHLVNLHYSSDPYQGSGWWASLNVALAIAHRLRVMSNLVPADEDQKAWGYLKNALGVLTELTMRNTDLFSVQALLGMALFLQGTPNPQPSFFLVAAAIRLSHSIGLHKRGSGFNLRPVEIEQRKRVFWIAYMVDKDICLRSGRPPAQDDDDMNVDLPSEDPEDNIGNIPLANGKDKINLFRLMCNFAVIESKVYKQLYSTKASKQSAGQLLNTIGDLDRELEQWKDSIPLELRPEYEIKASHTPLILHIVVLHFAYYNCLTTIHRMSVHHGYWTSRLSEFALKGLNAGPLNHRVFASATLCVQAARASIQLIKYIPQGDYACVWLILYFPVSSLVTLFANILQNPHDVNARSDLKLMHLVVNFLSMLSSDEEHSAVKRMLGICTEFERIVNLVLDRADKETPSKRKRRNMQAYTAKTQDQAKAPVVVMAPPAQDATAPTLVNLPFAPPTAVDTNFRPPVDPFATTESAPWMPVFSSNEVQDASNPADLFSADLPDLSQAYLNGLGSPPNMGLLPQSQQPFVPPDLWQMLEWDWAEMTGAPQNNFAMGNGMGLGMGMGMGTGVDSGMDNGVGNGMANPMGMDPGFPDGRAPDNL